MIRSLSVLALAATTIFSASGADRSLGARSVRLKSVPGTDSARALVRAAAARRASMAAQSRSAAATTVTATTAAAPGVVQINPADSTHEAYFVCTEAIPVGSYIQAYIVLSDQTELPLDSLEALSDLPAGYSLALPAVRDFSPFWKPGMTTYYVVVTSPTGNESLVAAEFPTGDYAPDYSRTQIIVPGIDNYVTYSSDDGSTIVRLTGRFVSGAPAYVAVNEYVVPSSDIWVESSSVLVFNLSKAVGDEWNDRKGISENLIFNTSILQNVLLTVGQDGWSDTTPFRHTPLQ